MTAFIVSVAIVAGTVWYVTWAAHHVAQGVAVWWFVAGAPVAYLAPAVVFATACCVLAWLWRTPRPPEARIGLAASLSLLAVESWTIAAGWPIMALHRWLIRDPAPAPATRPIVLVHGVLCNDGVWFAVRRHLAQAGIGPVYTLNYGPMFASTEHFAAQLAAKIDAVRAATGSARVVLVGHSLGGLVARAYLREFGGTSVSRLITVGTPHHGSIFAWLFPGWCLAQMRPGNAWLAALNRDEGAPPLAPTTALWSRHDTMVVPQASAMLGGAENVALIGIGHNALLRDREVMRCVAFEIGKTAPSSRVHVVTVDLDSGSAIESRTGVQAQSVVTTFLFTDIEGSTRLWEQDPDRMRPALARHDAILRAAVGAYRGTVVKMSGDGVHGAFADPLDALGAALQLQQALTDPQATGGIVLGVRCGLHAGVDERRDNDYFGSAVNRAARIMSAAHGGQVLVSQAVAALVRERLPAGTSLRDLGLVRLRDLADPERIYQLVHPQLRADFPALRTLEATPNNLPQQVTSFIGRERELSEVRKLLGGTRLLTLIGLGGIGKTRLSLQVAADAMDDYPDGVWFVELAPLADARLVPQAVASVVGVKEEAGRPVIEALIKYVRERRLLVVLDNCEHLVHACAELAKQLLQAGQHVKVLASSREHLHVAGEATYPVPTLAAPAPRETIDRAGLTRYEAVRLFIERAVAAQPAFQVTEQNAAAVADICTRLDGIPLAIELAAARVRALPVETIASRLDDRLRFLTGGDRTALPRQQTLRALIDWSYDLLTEHERALFGRLAVFAGGWTLEAAEAVGEGGGLAEADVLDLLTRLIEKSLVAVEAEGKRYRLLETVRQYARERLHESDEEDQARSRHLGFYLALAEKARPELVGPEQAVWLARLDLERENILSAHGWCDRAEGGAEAGVRLVYAVKPYFFNRGLLGLGHRLTVEALAREGAQGRNLARCKVLADAGQYCSFMGRYREAREHLEAGLAIAREIENTGMVARVLQPLGMASLGQGDVPTAQRYLEEALKLAREQGDKRELAGAINALAQLHRIQSDLETAEPLYSQVVTLARELGDREIIAVGLLNLAMASLGRGANERARTILLEALTIAEEIGSRPAGQSVVEVCAGLATLRKEWERAARFYGVAEAQIAYTGIQRDPTDEAFLKPLVAKARDALGLSSFAAAENEGRALSYDDAIAGARAWLEDRGG